MTKITLPADRYLSSNLDALRKGFLEGQISEAVLYFHDRRPIVCDHVREVTDGIIAYSPHGKIGENREATAYIDRIEVRLARRDAKSVRTIQVEEIENRRWAVQGIYTISEFLVDYPNLDPTHRGQVASLGPNDTPIELNLGEGRVLKISRIS